MNDRAEQDRDGRAGGVVVGGVEVQEQRGQPEAGAEHDPGGEVAAPGALDADQLHDPGGRDRDRHESPQRR